MATKEVWQQIGEGFVQVYYNQFDTTNRSGIVELYTTDACMTWEGMCFRGKEAIHNKLTTLPFRAIQHIVTEKDIQATQDSSILIMVIGQLKADNDHVMGFHETFMLKYQDQGRWACSNDMFRLAVHNIPA